MVNKFNTNNKIKLKTSYQKKIFFNHKIINKKYKKYLKILSPQLNEKNKTNFKINTWEGFLSNNFYRVILITFEFFKEFKKKYKKEKTLKKYYSFNTFAEIRSNLLTDRNFKACLYNIYKKKNCKIVNKKYKPPIPKSIKLNILEKVKYLILNKLVFKFLINIFRVRCLKISPNVAFIGSYFSTKNRIKLKFYGKGRYQTLNFPNFNFENKPNFEERSFLKKIQKRKDFDSFDKFFFNFLYFFFPTLYLENFNQNLKVSKDFFRKENFKVICNENFITNNKSSFNLMVGKTFFKIKHYYNEHNTLIHFLFGNYIERLTNYSDKYLNLGWRSKNSKIIKTGYMYGFNDEKYFIKPKKIYNIIYVTSIIKNEIHEYYDFLNSENYNVCKGDNFKKTFFKTLKKEIKDEIFFKLPKKIKQKNGKISIPEKILSRMKEDKFLPNNVSMRKYMDQAKLLIIDSIATVYLEALTKNIPFIIIAPKDLFLFNENINSIKPLIEAEIFFFDAHKAATFVNKHHGEYHLWWNSKKIQRARKKFININLRNEKSFINFFKNSKSF